MSCFVSQVLCVPPWGCGETVTLAMFPLGTPQGGGGGITLVTMGICSPFTLPLCPHDPLVMPHLCPNYAPVAPPLCPNYAVLWPHYTRFMPAVCPQCGVPMPPLVQRPSFRRLAALQVVRQCLERQRHCVTRGRLEWVQCSSLWSVAVLKRANLPRLHWHDRLAHLK